MSTREGFGHHHEVTHARNPELFKMFAEVPQKLKPLVIEAVTRLALEAGDRQSQIELARALSSIMGKLATELASNSGVTANDIYEGLKQAIQTDPDVQMPTNTQSSGKHKGGARYAKHS